MIRSRSGPWRRPIGIRQTNGEAVQPPAGQWVLQQRRDPGGRHHEDPEHNCFHRVFGPVVLKVRVIGLSMRELARGLRPRQRNVEARRHPTGVITSLRRGHSMEEEKRLDEPASSGWRLGPY